MQNFGSGVTATPMETMVPAVSAAGSSDGYLRSMIHRAIAEARAEGLDDDGQCHRAAEALFTVFRPYLDEKTLFELVRLLRD